MWILNWRHWFVLYVLHPVGRSLMHEPSLSWCWLLTVYTGFWFCCLSTESAGTPPLPFYTSQLVHHSHTDKWVERLENWPGQNLTLPGSGQKIERLLKDGSCNYLTILASLSEPAQLTFTIFFSCDGYTVLSPLYSISSRRVCIDWSLALLKIVRCRKTSSCTPTKCCYLSFQNTVNVNSIVFLFLSANTLHRAGIFKQSMGAKNRVRIRLSYRSARARIGNLLRSPGFDSQPGGPVGKPYLT